MQFVRTNKSLACLLCHRVCVRACRLPIRVYAFNEGTWFHINQPRAMRRRRPYTEIMLFVSDPIDGAFGFVSAAAPACFLTVSSCVHGLNQPLILYT